VLELIALAALGLFIGAYGTVIGAGGGFILVPVLLFLYPDYEPEEITSISLAVVCASAVSGSAAYWRQRRIDYVTAALFIVCSVPGVVAGALVIEYVPERVFTGLFALMLLGLAATSLRNRPQAVRTPLRGPGVLVRQVREPGGRTYLYAYRVWQGAVMSLGVGFISSLFGIGGGVIQVPAMIMLLHVPVQFAVATSLFVLSFMTGGATAIHVATGTLGGDQAVKALALAVGAVPGGQLGALIGQRIRGRSVLMLLAGAIAVLGVRLLVKAIADV
jgi:uncharacterized membrane protein YfcA